MAQFVSSDATISILTDDENSSENEIYSRTEPETESRSARIPMIVRRDWSRDRGDGQSDASDGLQSTKNGICNGKHGGVSINGVLQSIETGSNGCLGTSLSPTTLLVLCLLIAVFPVHFPSVLLPDIRSTEVALQATVCLAIVGAIASSMTSQLAFKIFNFRSLLVAGCVGVMVFAVVRCVVVVPAAVLGCGSFVAAFLLTAVRVATAGVYCPAVPPSPMPSLLDGDGLQPRRRGVEKTSYLASGLLILACCGLAPFISASLHLTFLATSPSTSTDTDISVTSLMTSSVTSLMTASVTSFPPINATMGLDTNLSSWSNVTMDLNTSSVATLITTGTFPAPTDSSYNGRMVALLVSYVVCSLGALLLVLCTFGDERHWKDRSPLSVSGVGRLVIGPLSAFRRQDVVLLTPLALFVGAQQMFAYFTYIQVSSMTESAGIYDCRCFISFQTCENASVSMSSR